MSVVGVEDDVAVVVYCGDVAVVFDVGNGGSGGH